MKGLTVKDDNGNNVLDDEGRQCLKLRGACYPIKGTIIDILYCLLLWNHLKLNIERFQLVN